MADSVVKLRIDSKEYDANIKRAGQALSDYMRRVREGGDTLSALDDGVMEAVQALGQLGTKAEGTRGGLRELTQTITDLTVEYRALTDEEKNTPFGREMVKAIDQLTERAGNIRDAMGDVQGAINNVASDTRAFDQMAQGVSIATSAFQGLTGAGQLLGINMGDNLAVIAKLQAAMAVTNSLTTIQNALQSQSALMQGVAALQTKAAAVAQSLLAKNTIAATVAQRAFNAVAKANPVGLVVGALVAATTAIIAFSKSSSEASQREKDERDVRIRQMQREKAERDRLAQKAKAEAETISTAAGEKIAKYEMLRNAWSQLQTEQQKSTFIRENANLFNELGLSINSSADAMKAFVTNSAKVIEALDSMAKADALKDLLKDAYKQQYSTLPPGRESYRPTTAEMRYYAPSALHRTWEDITQEDVDRHIEQYINSQEWAKQAGINKGDFRVSPDLVKGEIKFSLNAAGASKLTDYRQQTGTQKIQDENNANVERLKNMLNTATQESLKKQAEAGVFTTPGITTPTTPTKGDNTTRELTKEQKIQQQINKLVEENYSADVNRQAEIRKEVRQLQEQLEARKKIREELLGINDESKKQEDLQKKLTEAVKERSEALAGNDLKAFYAADSKVAGAGGASIAAKGFTATDNNIAAFIENLKTKIGQTDVGTTLYTSLTSQLRDAEAFKSIIEKAVKNGITTADFNQNEIWKKIFTENGNIPNETWRGLLKSINDELLKAGFEPIKLTATVDYSENESDGNENSDGKNTKSSSNKKSKREEDEETDNKNKKNKGDKINSESLSQLTSGMSSMVSGIEQLGVKVPDGLKDVITALQGITTILTAIQTISAAKFWSNGGIVHAATGIIVPGNHFSGDLVPSMINSGELILNRSQQNALAHQLSENSQQEVYMQPFVDGEKIFLGMNNTSRRMGRGEIVTTSTLRHLGLI